MRFLLLQTVSPTIVQNTHYICSIPYAYFVPYAYGTIFRTIRVRYRHTLWYVPYAYYAFSQYLLALPSHSYNGLSLQVFLAEQT